MDQDIRWKQRFSNFKKAFKSLKDAVELSKSRQLSLLEKQGVIQGFEFTHELAWNVMKDYLESKGVSKLIGSKDATRSAFKNGLIADGDIWMQMIADRNLSSHTYDEKTAQTISSNICGKYYSAYKELLEKFSEISSQELSIQ